MMIRALPYALAACLLAVASPVAAQGWQGPYVGFHLGGAVADLSGQSPTIPGPAGDTAGMVGGIQMGYNWQRGASVLGAEADLSLTDISDRFTTGQFEEEMMTSLRLRAGVTQGETLVFGSLGVAWTERQVTTGAGSSHAFEPGLMVGGGAERFLWDHVTGRVEAYYVDAPTESHSIGTTTTSGGSQNLILRAGLSLHF